MDRLTPKQRRKNMQRVRSKGSQIELKLRHALWHLGLRYRKNVREVFGCPDIVFQRLKIAIFCDSEFWHGYDWNNRKHDFKSHQEFWIPKIERNIQRDEEVNQNLKIYYRENISDCATLANILDERDPLNLKSENLYPHKLKKFLCAVALELNPTKHWNGVDDANGGYIIVKETGEVVAYHLHNRNNFENYLLNSTRLDTPSMSRHKFGNIYEEQGRNFINLNLQIRFK